MRKLANKKKVSTKANTTDTPQDNTISIHSESSPLHKKKQIRNL